MSAPMDFPTFRELLKHINAEHSPNKIQRGDARKVKYVDPHIDMRTGAVFSLTIRGFGWSKTLHTMNEAIDIPESLYDRTMAFLDGAGDVDGAEVKLSRDKLFDIVLGEIGSNLAAYGAEFGSKEVSFTVPLGMLADAIKEKESGK